MLMEMVHPTTRCRSSRPLIPALSRREKEKGAAQKNGGLRKSPRQCGGRGAHRCTRGRVPSPFAEEILRTIIILRCARGRRTGAALIAIDLKSAFVRRSARAVERKIKVSRFPGGPEFYEKAARTYPGRAASEEPISVTYFNRSKVFWRICQSFKPATFSCDVLLIFASLAFLVGRWSFL
jgi:hypothetical protein